MEENGARFLADLLERAEDRLVLRSARQPRASSPRLAQGARVLDLYCYTGGFARAGGQAGAARGRRHRPSEPALALAEKAAARNGVAELCPFRRAEAFEELERLAAAGERFDIVIADPPAFVKSQKDLEPGCAGLSQAGAAGRRAGRAGRHPVSRLLLAQCRPAEFAEAVRRGLADAGRSGRILRAAGADADHPVHPALPETAYLKSLLLQLD